MPTSSTLSQLIATPLSERASRQFSSHEDNTAAAAEFFSSTTGAVPHHADILRLQNEASTADKSSCRPAFRRSHSMFDHATPNSRSQGCDSPMAMSPVARGLFVHDEDPGSSPLAPLGLHALRLRMKPSRVIQPVSCVFSFFFPSFFFLSFFSVLLPEG